MWPEVNWTHIILEFSSDPQMRNSARQTYLSSTVIQTRLEIDTSGFSSALVTPFSYLKKLPAAISSTVVAWLVFPTVTIFWAQLWQEGPKILGCVCICLHLLGLTEAINLQFSSYITRISEFSSQSFISPTREKGLHITAEQWFRISVCDLSEFLNDAWNSRMEITLGAYCTCKNSLERM